MKKIKKPKPEFHPLASLRTRSFRVGGYSIAATAMVVAIAVVVNLLVNALPTRVTELDATSNQLYSLSDQSKTMVSGLEQEIEIYWVVRSGREDATLGHLLDQYTGLSDKLTVTKKDPEVYPTFVQQYTSSVSDNDLILVCGENYRYVSINDIYVYDYSSYYTTGSYDTSFAGESEITGAINYLISEDQPKLYTLTGHGEASLDSSFTTAVEKENFVLEELSLLTVEAVPEDADALLIYAPRSDYAEEECALLEDYLRSGGGLILVTSPLEDGSNLPNLEAVLADYGVTVNEGIVIEGSSQHYALGTPYYLLPSYGSHEISNPLKQDGYYVLLPIAQGLSVSDTLRDGVSVTKVLTTSDEAYSKAAGYALTTYEKEDGDLDGPFALAVAITESAGEDSETNIFWVSSSSLLDSKTNSQVSGGNQDLFLNALHWMCGQTESISIHAKSMNYEYLTMNSSTASLLSALVVAVIPAAYLTIGIVTWIRRKRR